MTVFCVPQLLFAAAVCTLLDRPILADWLVLAVSAVALGAAAGALIARRAPAVADRSSRSAVQARG